VAIPLALRAITAVVLGAGAGYCAWQRVAEIRPYLVVEPKRAVRTENYDLWDLRVTAHGGETIGQVRVEPQSPRLHLVGTGTIQGLKSGVTATFRLEFADASDNSTARVYVWQEGSVSNTYDVLIGGK
jgi:hypothetical protein